MIKIRWKTPDKDDKPWQRWRQACDKQLATLKKVAGPGKQFAIDDVYKRKSIKKRFYFSKSGPFHGKCAYCEAYIADFQHPDIEHFRPKKGVTEEDDSTVRVREPGGKLIGHPGYWWLAFDVENLLPSCKICNEPAEIDGTKVGKHKRFPIAGTRAEKPGDDLEAEDPLILNPLRDDPRDHLTVGLEREEGLLIAKTERGAACIRIFGLNLRDQLVDQRKDAIDKFKGLVVKYMYYPAVRNKTLAEMQAVLRGEKAHTSVSRAVNKDLDLLREVSVT